MSEIKDLKFDNKNFNKHTERGLGLLGQALQKHGAGRSILIDKDNNIIAGNGVVEAAGQVGIDKVKVVETTGDEIVAVKRVDVELDSKDGREMAMEDNAIASIDLDWDDETIKEESEKWNIDLSQWNFSFDKEEKFVDIEETNILEIYFDNEEEQQKIYEEMTKRGYKCKLS